MVQLAQPANTEGNNEKMGDYSPVPPNKYVVAIVKSEYKTTKAKNGHYLQMDMKIQEGEYKGRTLFERLNLDNPNPTAVEIANKTLNTICDACGKFGVEDSDELHGIPMVATVVKTEATKTQPAGNDIKFYEKYVEGDAGPSMDPADNIEEKAEEKAAPAAKKKLPWEE